MAEEILPPVAQKIYTDCKKCDAERYHVVLAHTSATAAKVQCEVCKSKKTYKLPSAKRAATAAAKKRKPNAAAKKTAHEKEYLTLMEANPTGEASKYNMKGKFNTNQKVEHPKFGLGIIKSIQPDKIEVLFSDEVRMLVHNRP